MSKKKKGKIKNNMASGDFKIRTDSKDFEEEVVKSKQIYNMVYFSFSE